MYSTSFCGPIEIRAKTPSSAHSPREPESIPIVASINDNILSITIGNNVGVAHIRIGKEDGTNIVHENIFSTPHLIMPPLLLMTAEQSLKLIHKKSYI